MKPINQLATVEAVNNHQLTLLPQLADTQRHKPAVSLTSQFDKLADSDQKRFLTLFWLRMTEIYEELWTRKSAKPTDLWIEMLSEFEPQTVLKALDDVKKFYVRFPPKLPEFRELCVKHNPKNHAFQWIAMLRDLENDIENCQKLLRFNDSKEMHTCFSRAIKKRDDFIKQYPQVLQLAQVVRKLPTPPDVLEKRKNNAKANFRAIKASLNFEVA